MNTATSRSIVVGIDGSKSAVKAALWAAAEAVRRDVALRLVYVVQPDADDTNEAFAEGRRMVGAAADALSATGEQVKVESDVLRGAPVDVLTEASRSAEMLCVGWKGRHDSGAAGRGATAAHLAVAAHSSVAIVRRRSIHHEVGPDRWIVAVVDSEATFDGVLRVAIDEATLRHAGILALAPWRNDPAAIDRIRTKLDSRADRAEGPGAQIRRCLLPLPDHMSSLFAQSADIDQLVIAAASNRELVGELTDRRTNRILRGSECSVLILRDAENRG